MSNAGNNTRTRIRHVLEEADTDGTGRIKMVMADLTDKCGRSDRSVQKALAKLYMSGVLDTEYDPEDGARIFVLLRRTSELTR